FEDYPYWIAHYYVDKVQYKGQNGSSGSIRMWASCRALKATLDFNIYNGSYYELKQLCIGSNNNEKKFME
ncbi:glycosyl hydrolase, family 25, partial [human gut metagenome]